MAPYHFSYVYILHSMRNAQQIYIGYTQNLRKRLTDHNAGEVISTKRYLPWRLMYYEAFSEDISAQKREWQLKNNGNAMRELKKRVSVVFKKSDKGFSLIEVVVAVALCLTIVLGIVGAFTGVLKLTGGNMARVQAAFLEEEGLEAARILRDNGWSTNINALATSTPYNLIFDGTWKATTTRAYIDSMFYRTLVVDPVYRDASKNIVTSGGTLDASIKKITVSVSWMQGRASTTRSLSTYLTNIFAN